MVRPHSNIMIGINYFLVCFVLATVQPVIAQDSPLRVYMYLDFFRTDDSKYLQAELKYREDGVFKQLEDMEVAFTMSADTMQVDLGNRITSNDGLAQLDLSNIVSLADSNGVTQYVASFEGNKSFKAASRDIAISELKLALEAEVVDSTHLLKVVANKQVAGSDIAVDDLDIKIMIQRLFGLLTIAEISTNEDGRAEFEFPADLPGDVRGDLQVFAMTEDHDDFGTVQTRETLTWGRPVHYKTNQEMRTLWSRDAPLWIIITVLALFLVVWYHYILAVSQLFKIKKL